MPIKLFLYICFGWQRIFFFFSWRKIVDFLLIGRRMYASLESIFLFVLIDRVYIILTTDIKYTTYSSKKYFLKTDNNCNLVVTKHNTIKFSEFK